MQIGSTHILFECGVGEALSPRIYLQVHTDHWDETQKPDILDHTGPLRQLSTLNSENGTWLKITDD